MPPARCSKDGRRARRRFPEIDLRPVTVRSCAGHEHAIHLRYSRGRGVPQRAMSEVIVRRRHGLQRTHARRLAETMAERLQNDFGGTYAWEGDTLRFQRTGASGHVLVTAHDVEIRVDLSLWLAPLHGRIEREIVAFCDEHFPQAAPDRAQAPRRTVRGASPRSSGAPTPKRPR